MPTTPCTCGQHTLPPGGVPLHLITGTGRTEVHQAGQACYLQQEGTQEPASVPQEAPPVVPVDRDVSDALSAAGQVIADAVLPLVEKINQARRVAVTLEQDAAAADALLREVLNGPLKTTTWAQDTDLRDRITAHLSP